VRILPTEPSTDLFYTVRLTKEARQKFGVLVNTRSTTERLRVVNVEADSVADEWNKLHPLTPMRIGDFIIEVNGLTGGATSLLEQCKDASCLQLTLMRPPSEGGDTPTSQPEKCDIEDLDGRNLALESTEEGDDVGDFGPMVLKPLPSEWQSPKAEESKAEVDQQDDGFGAPVAAPLASSWQALSAESTKEDDEECFGEPVGAPTPSVWKPPAEKEEVSEEADDDAGFGAPVGAPTKSTWIPSSPTSPPTRGGC